MTTTDPMTIAAAYVSQVERAKKLHVTPDPDHPGCLLVDATLLMETPNDVRFWVLQPVAVGQWRHMPSDSTAPLSEALRAIACCYPAVPQTGWNAS